MHLIKNIYIFHKIQINNLFYMNLKHNFVLIKLNKIEETFILKLKILYFYIIF